MDKCIIGGVEAYDVRDFGAVGDNKADDTAAIQACIDAAYEAGVKAVYIPPFPFYPLVTRTIFIPADTEEG